MKRIGSIFYNFHHILYQLLLSFGYIIGIVIFCYILYVYESCNIIGGNILYWLLLFPLLLFILFRSIHYSVKDLCNLSIPYYYNCNNLNECEWLNSVSIDFLYGSFSGYSSRLYTYIPLNGHTCSKILYEHKSLYIMPCITLIMEMVYIISFCIYYYNFL